MTEATDELLTVREVARRLGLRKAAAVLAHIHAGRLQAVNVGAGTDRPTWRVSSADLAAFLASRRAVPADKPARRLRRPAGGVTTYF